MSRSSLTVGGGLLLAPVFCAAACAGGPPPPNAPAPRFVNTGHPAADKKAFAAAIHRRNKEMVYYWDRQARLRHIQTRYRKD